MPTSAIMTQELVTLPPTATVAEAMWLMHEKHLRSVPVVDGKGRFLGLFGVRRLARLLLPKTADFGFWGTDGLGFLPDEVDKLSKRLREAGQRPISEFLEKKKKLSICSPDTPFPKLLSLLEESQDTSLPVILVEEKGHKLVGVVSAWDVLERLALAMLEGTGQTPGNADEGRPKPTAERPD